MQIYTWYACVRDGGDIRLDANLRELAQLVQEVIPDARKRGARFTFAMVYPDRFGKPVVREVMCM